MDTAAPANASLLLVGLPGLVLGRCALDIGIQVTHVLEGEFHTVWTALEDRASLLQQNTATPGTEATRRQALGRQKQALKLAHLGASRTLLVDCRQRKWLPSPRLPGANSKDSSQNLRQSRWDSTKAADEGLLSIVARLPQGKSPGPSGMSAEHLQGANQQTQVALIRVLRQLATAPENFPSPLTRALRSSRLLPFAKPPKESAPQENPGVRPIGVPEVLRKVATQWTLRAVIDRAHLSCEPDAVVLRLDLENAFNRIDQRLAKKLVDQHFPELAVVYRLGYGSDAADSPTLCGWRSAPGENQTEHSRLTLQAATGVQQGDPLGPVLHALALAPFLKALRTKFSDLTIVAIHDHITIVGPLQELKQALAWSRTMLPSLGARLQLNKCTLYGRALTTARVINREIPDIQVTREGVTIHSIPIGNREYIEHECRALQNKHEKVIKEIAQLPQHELNAQVALFRY
ncbi:hypothetical protein NDN08_004844 [Rhodosorus marinus]|uniref:Reverse transcriptase domain-containing protein n=1 Tax=Rhodosorus marinus TaxID=101924 RepID=A0AAV8UMG1_9RHOD|nr:hypothetical protein NDN08_004844 [Rhodosorus marinus]